MITGTLLSFAASVALPDRAVSEATTTFFKATRQTSEALSSAAIGELSRRCAPYVAPTTVAAIIRTESRGKPLALYVNGARQPKPQRSVAEAVATARTYTAAGYSVDLGLGQINSRNMARLGLTWNTVFDPCTNIAALGRVISENYAAALVGREPQTALRIAFSLYNTGSRTRGFRNGYVDRVVGHAGVSLAQETDPPLPAVEASDGRLEIVAENTAIATAADFRQPAPAPWNIFARAAQSRRAMPQSATIRSMSVWSD